MTLSNYVQKQIKAKTYGTALMQISIRDLRKLRMLIPDLNEQHHIVEKLDALSKETGKFVTIHKNKLEGLEELKKSLLQKAFAGELTRDEVAL